MSVYEARVVLQDSVGLHARPAALVVQEANKFKCTIRLSKEGGGEVDGKSILGIMSMNVGRGATVTIRTEGEDAHEAIVHIVALLTGTLEGESYSVVRRQ